MNGLRCNETLHVTSLSRLRALQVRGLLCKDPKSRLSAAEALEHRCGSSTLGPWLKQQKHSAEKNTLVVATHVRQEILLCRQLREEARRPAVCEAVS